MAQTSLSPCESCRITVDRYRFGPCAMCAEDRLRNVVRGDMSCDHCGRKLTRYTVVLVQGRGPMRVGTTCAVRLIEEGAIEA